MRHCSLSRAIRQLTRLAGQSESHNALPASLFLASTENKPALSTVTCLGTQLKRVYSQTNTPKPSLGLTGSTQSRKCDGMPVNLTETPKAVPRENGDHFTGASQFSPDLHECHSSAGRSFSPPGGNLPGGSGSGSIFPITSSPLLDAALTTIIGLGMVFVGGIAYLEWYKTNVLDKMEHAFAAGYDPALELATLSATQADISDDLNELAFDINGNKQKTWSGHLRRREQDRIDQIVHGIEKGHYFVLLGPKGSGKATMIFDAMQVNKAEGVAMCDAHPDLEVFRLRLGKALNYEYNEDSQTGLFQRRDPREGGAALDIERALNKLEKVALRSTRRTGRPLVLILNNVHFFKNDDDGQNMLLQLQQRAESWAASGILTLVFSTDDFWPFLLMRKSGSRMHVLSIYDLDHKEALHALTRMRRDTINHQKSTPANMLEAVSIVGGRLQFLNNVSKAPDMAAMAREMLAVEKAWLLSQIGLIPDCDDDVMDEQKWSSCSWLLLREFVKLRQKQEDEARSSGLKWEDVAPYLPLPSIPYWKCRQIMTRPDFLEALDHANIIAIDINHDVRPDSTLVLHAAREVVEEDGFDEMLASVRDRVDEIESLHRTRELTFKDIGKREFAVDKGGSLAVGDDS